MSVLLIEVPVDAVSIDENRSPDNDERHILEHLVRYCAKFDPLPAITVVLDGMTARVVRGHKYLLAARTLGRRTIQAVIAGAPPPEQLKSFLLQANGKELDWEAIRSAEEQEPVLTGWHVFFFARPLTGQEKRTFDEVVASVFCGQDIAVIHDDSGPLAEFAARTPVTDVSWARRHLESFAGFSQDYVPIVSYQGGRFGR